MGVLRLFKIKENDRYLGQTDIGVSSFQRVLNKISDSIPNALKVINDGVREYNEKLRDHEKLYLSQAWFASSKKPSRP